MSPDLLAAFFDRDLTEAEDEALAARLRDSVLEAARFAELGAAYYASLGLPEPVWPGPVPARRRFHGRTAAVIVGLLLAGGGLRVASQRLQADRPPSVPEDRTGGLPSRPAAAPIRPTPRTGSRALPPRRAAATGPAATSETAGGVATDLVVKVLLAAPTALAVDVYDEAGTPIRHLAAGTYPAGIRRFRWDALDDAGRAVPGGDYRIMVTLAGGRTMERRLRLKAAP